MWDGEGKLTLKHLAVAATIALAASAAHRRNGQAASPSSINVEPQLSDVSGFGSLQQERA
jgi:hypothetical protein